MDVCGRLLSARERAGLTIEEISARTRINATFLQAIERGEFDRLPGAFFTRAFLRTYARELRLSPDEIVAAYDARFPSAPSSFEEGRTAGPAPDRTVSGTSPGSRRPWIPAMAGAWPLAVLVAAVLVVVSVMNRPARRGSSEPRAIGTTGVVEASASTATTREPSAPEKLTIEIRPSRTLWVAGAADGLRVIYRLVEPGERVSAEARGELWFRVGDAGAFDYSINGLPGKPVGGPGEVREFRITPENFRSFHR